MYNHFYDIDNDNLSYNVTGNSSVRIIINQTTKNVTLTPTSNWYGTETIYFTATDGQYTADSNNIILTVSNANDCGDGSCESGEETSCAADCDWCGDSECNAGETCSSCSNDCGSCEGTTGEKKSPVEGEKPQPPAEAAPVTFSPTVSATTKTSLPCTNITYTETGGNLTLSQANITELEIPEGYGLAIEPFSL